jgi:hypothetical protein
MIAESESEHVEDFPLIPIRRAPNTGNRIDFRNIGRRDAAQATLQAVPLIALQGMQMIDDFETGLGRRQIHGRDATQADELLTVFEIAAQIDDAVRGPQWMSFAKRLRGFEIAGDSLGIFFLE